jgi:hypothetical protein
MNSRYVAARLFFVVAALFALVGAALLRRGVIGSGQTRTEYLNPLFLVVIPKSHSFCGLDVVSLFWARLL